RGMINKGNLCFANAILQTLVYCAPFYNLFRVLGQTVPHDLHNSTPLMEAVIQFLSEFKIIPAEVQKNFASEPFVPEQLYEAMKLNKRFDTMRRGHQEDAEEFLGFILDTLHEELQSTIQKAEARERKAQGKTDKEGQVAEQTNGGLEEEEERVVNRPVSPSEGDGWLEVGQKGKTSFTRTTSTSHSPITRIFGGKLRSVLRTPGSKDSVTLEPYQPLQLDIQPSHVSTVEEALENLTRPETISGVLSSTRTLVDATKQVFIETLPPILVLHLKRFYYDDVGGVQKSSKVLGYGSSLEISESVISPARRGEAQRRYKLFGVVYHHGRFASGGHYTVDVLRQDRSEWIHIDDTTWSIASTPQAKASH
ncbi:cysteine proteinase, partial [Meira miltonrushii]